MVTSEKETEQGKKKRAIKFEDKIKQFLQNLEFNDVDGAKDSFRIGFPKEHQIDVIAGWENTVFVFECKSAREFNTTKNLKKDLYEFKGKIPDIKEGLKKHPTYKKYNNYRYILVVNEKVVLRPEDKKIANTQPSIYLWNEDFLEYYNNLYSYLKPYAKYDLLGEMGIRPLDQEPIRIPAFKVNFGDVIMYNFVVNPKDLLEVAYVARREKGEERYYQRIIDKKRLNKIAGYIEADGKFPNNIIIAFKEGSHVKFIGKDPYTEYNKETWPFLGIEFGILEFPKDYRSCWIIDGQHRLYAFVNTDKWFNMPVTAFENLSIEDQCRFFLDINKNQKPVDSDLLWDLNGDMIPSEREGIISNVVKGLNNTKGSPLYHMIYIPSSGIKKKKELIKLSAICMAVKKRRLTEKSTNEKNINPLFEDDYQKRINNVVDSLSNYFRFLKELLPSLWELGPKGFIISNGGISVMIGLYQKILERAVSKNGRKPSEDDFKFYLTPLKDIFNKDYNNESKLKTLTLRCTSEGGRSELLAEFVMKIKSATGDQGFGGEIENPQSKEFRELEQKLRELINLILSERYGENWIENKEVVPEDISKRCFKYLKEHNLEGKEKPYTQLTLGPCCSIIQKNEDLFNPIFVNDENGFANNVEFNAAIKQITRVRNTQTSHSVKAPVKAADEARLKLNLDQINECINEFLESKKE